MNNNIILYNISKFIIFDEYRNLSLISCDIRKELMSNIPLHIKNEFAIKELIYDGYPLQLLYIFNPIKLYNIPIYPKKIFRGFTDYIDYIDPSYFNNISIIRGKDELNRAYISFYYNNKITTIFQRYTDNKTRWVSGGENTFGNRVFVFDLTNNYYYNDTLIKILSKLLNNKIYIENNKIYKLNY